MKINHHQIKNAVAYLAKSYEQNFPNSLYHLGGAVFRHDAWELRTYLPISKGETIDIFAPLHPIISLDKLSTDENISLENIHMETAQVGSALDVAARFINHSEKIGTVSLMYLLDESTEADKKWRLDYAGVDNKDEYIFLTILVDTQAETILNVELDYPRVEIAREIAESFLKQSEEIVNAKKSFQAYEGKGIHIVSYTGIDKHGDAIELSLKIDSESGVILTNKIIHQK